MESVWSTRLSPRTFVNAGQAILDTTVTNRSVVVGTNAAMEPLASKKGKARSNANVVSAGGENTAQSDRISATQRPASTEQNVSISTSRATSATAPPDYPVNAAPSAISVPWPIAKTVPAARLSVSSNSSVIAREAGRVSIAAMK